METQYLLALTLIILSICHRLFCQEKHDKNLPPSPLSLPIIGHFHLMRKPINNSIDKLLEKFGSILFLQFGSRPVLVLASPTAVKECFTKRDIIFANRPQLGPEKLVNKYSTIPTLRYGDMWRHLRRFTTIEMFSTSRLSITSGIREKETSILVSEMVKSYNGEFKKVDLKSVFYKLVLNFLARILGMEHYFDAEEMLDPRNGKDKMEELRNAFAPKDFSRPGDFIPFMRWIDRRTNKNTLEFIDKRDKLIQNIIDDTRSRWSTSSSSLNTCSSNKDKKELEEKKRTVLESLFSSQENEPEFYTDDIIKGIILVTFSAGSISTTTRLEWAMSFLLNHPEVLSKARCEIEVNVGNDRLLNESDLVNLPYLNNIINETLRLCTPAHYIVPHESSKDCTIGGYDIPKGTMVLVDQGALHKDLKFWSEPTLFKPERFEISIGEAEGIHWIPFGLGRRACPGERMAMRMLGLTLGVLIQCFDWDLVGDGTPDMRVGEKQYMHQAKLMEVMYRPRKHMLNISLQL